MKPLFVADNIVPIGEFKAHAAGHLDRLRDTGDPMVLTQNGRPAAVLLAPDEYDAMCERERFLSDIAAGIADAESGATLEPAAVRARLAERRRPR
jgi:prevent-host-death family protein